MTEDNDGTMNKKAQGLSFRVIIVAVLGLMVLIIVILIFTGKAGTFINQTGTVGDTYSGQKCSIPGTDAKCRPASACDQIDGTDLGKKDCKDQICCSR